MKELILKKKPSAVVLLLRDSTQQWYPSKLAKSAGATYVYVTQLLSRMSKEGFVVFDKKGKQKFVTLTERGVLAAAALDEFVKKSEAPKQAPVPAQPAQEKKEPQPADRSIA